MSYETHEITVKAMATQLRVKELKAQLPTHVRMIPEVHQFVRLIESLCDNQLRIAKEIEECIYGERD